MPTLRSLAITVAVLLSFVACHKRQAADYYYESTYVCTGEVTRYPAYKVKATESLLATIKEEVHHIKVNYPRFKIRYFSGFGGEHDFITLSRPFHNDVTVAYNVMAFVDASRSDYHRMTKGEALSIVKYLVDEDMLCLHMPKRQLQEVYSWPTQSGGTLNVETPGKGWRGRYRWEFGDWVHRLYNYGPVPEPWPRTTKQPA